MQLEGKFNFTWLSLFFRKSCLGVQPFCETRTRVFGEREVDYALCAQKMAWV
jgi:hypothetical protein